MKHATGYVEFDSTNISKIFQERLEAIGTQDQEALFEPKYYIVDNSNTGCRALHDKLIDGLTSHLFNSDEIAKDVNSGFMKDPQCIQYKEHRNCIPDKLEIDVNGMEKKLEQSMQINGATRFMGSYPNLMLYLASATPEMLLKHENDIPKWISACKSNYKKDIVNLSMDETTTKVVMDRKNNIISMQKSLETMLDFSRDAVADKVSAMMDFDM